MPRRSTVAPFWPEILSRLESGERLIDVCLDKRLPRAPAVRNYAYMTKARRAQYDAAIAPQKVTPRSIVVANIQAIADIIADGWTLDDAIRRLGLPLKPIDISSARCQYPEVKRALDEAHAKAGKAQPKRRYLAEHFDKFVKLIESGCTVREALAADDRFPVDVAYNQFILANPNLARLVDIARLKRAQIAPEAPLATALNHNALYIKARKAVPRNIPYEDREDVAADIAIALLESGDAVDGDELKELAATLATAHMKRTGRQRDGIFSLDKQTKSEDGNLTRGDTIAGETAVDVIEW